MPSTDGADQRATGDARFVAADTQLRPSKHSVQVRNVLLQSPRIATYISRMKSL